MKAIAPKKSFETQAHEMMNMTLSTTFGQGSRLPQNGVSACFRGAAMLLVAVILWGGSVGSRTAHGAALSAGVAKVDITDREAGPVNDPLYVRALVVKSDTTTAVIITVDAVAIGEIGHIKNDYLPKVRARLEKELEIPPANVLVNASHCHGVVCAEVGERTFQAVKAAAENLVPVTVGAGVGREDRIMVNRRLKLKTGREIDVRHAYSLPPDDEVADVGPIDPQIGVLRLDREDGRTLAVVYNFACHPIQGVPGGGNTADITGFASKVIEDNLGEGGIALLLQGCCGDINPVFYKAVDRPRDAEPLGNTLGLSTLEAVRKIQCREDGRLTVLKETIALPRGDRAERIVALQAEQKRLLGSLKGTSLNLKTFVPLFVKYGVADDYPSYYSHRYLHEKALGRDELSRLDTENRRNMQAYIQNIYVMEELTRLQTNLALLRKHQASLIASGKQTIDIELLGVRIGDFVLVTFPGELSVQIGLNIKQRSPHPHTFVAAYTNGYIYYAPTAEQLRNVGGAQEDSDCILAPQWQGLFEGKVVEMLKRL
jgi:hypothetical protein